MTSDTTPSSTPRDTLQDAMRAGVREALLHLAIPRQAGTATTIAVHIAMARSSNATATRRFAGASTASS